MWYTYLLECADGRLYCGSTTDLEWRVAEHNSGEGAKYTSLASRRPVVLVWSEPHLDRSTAQTREAQIKKITRLEKLALVAKRSATA